MLYEISIINGCLAVRYLHRTPFEFPTFLLLRGEVEDFDCRYTANGQHHKGVRHNILTGTNFPYDSSKDDWWTTTIPAERMKDFLSYINSLF